MDQSSVEFGAQFDPSLGGDKGSPIDRFETRINGSPQDRLPAAQKFREVKPSNTDPDVDPQIEALLNMLFGGNKENTSLKLTESNMASQMIEGMRRLTDHDDNPDIADPIRDHWIGPRVESSFVERMANFRTPIKKLQAMKIIEGYNSATGYANISDKDFEGYALRVERDGEEKKFYIGKDDIERSENARKYEIAYREYSIRKIVGEHVGLSMSGAYRDSLEGLTEMRHTRAGKLTITQLQEIWNLPSVENVDANIKDHTYGEQVEEAMFLYEVMLHSSTKKDMMEFMARPGATVLMDRIRKRGKEDGSTLPASEWIKKYIGEYWRWVDDKDRHLINGKDLKSGKGFIPTYITEGSEGKRGPLTINGNMAAFEGLPGEKLSFDAETAFINQVGVLVGDVGAAWFGGSILRAFEEFSSRGYAILDNGEFVFTLGEGQFISPDDLAKFHVFLYQLKEYTKKRPSGPKDLIGRVPDLSMGFLDWARVKIQLPDGSYGRRSMIDAWLGTAKGKKVDILTGKPTEDDVNEEGYHRLGSLNFGSLQRGVFGSFVLMDWLKGREEWGLIGQIMKTDFRPEDFTLANEKKLQKYIGIILNRLLLSHGSEHKYKMDSVDKVADNLLFNIHEARKRTAWYVKNMLGKVTELLNPDIRGAVDPYSEALIQEDAFSSYLNTDVSTNANIKSFGGMYSDSDSDMKSGEKRVVKAGRVYDTKPNNDNGLVRPH